MPQVIDKRAFFEKVDYTPHPGQLNFHTSEARFRVAVCGRRYGKSTMAARDCEPELFLPDRMYWIVGPTYDLGEKEFRIIWDDLMVKRALGKRKDIRKAYNKKTGSMFIQFPWNTRIEVRSADHPENLVGESLDGVILSEAAKHRRDTWERILRPALADKRGWATFATTPEGYNWVHNIWQFGQQPDMPDYESWRMPSWENSAVFPLGRQDPEIKMIEETTSAEWFAQEYGAEFTSFVGKIYSEFDELMHVRPIAYNPAWPNYIAFDWGFVNPLAAIEFQVDPMDNVYIWREHYQANMRLAEHLNFLKNRPQPDGYQLVCTYGDSADQEAVATVNQTFAPCFAMDEAKANWRQGVELVKRFLKPIPTGLLDEFGSPILKPKLFVDHSCKNTYIEFQNYRMAPAPRTGTADPQEKPTKKDDHAMDAIRYGLMHLFELGAKYHLSDVQPRPEYRETDIGSATNNAMALSLGGREGVFTKSMEF